MEDNTDIANYMPKLREYAKNARYVLELGPAKGNGSTKAFYEGLCQAGGDDLLLISVDRVDYMEFKPPAPWFHLVMGDSRSLETLYEVQKVSKKRTPDIIFIDTHHTPEQMADELKVWPDIAGENTIFLFHDTYMMGKYNPMTDVIKKFCTDCGWIYKDISMEAHGLAAMWLE